MSVDRVSNMLSAIKNASMAGKSSLEIPHSKMCEEVAKALKKAGFVGDVKTFKEKGVSYKTLKIGLVFDENGLPVITDVKRVSKPGRRVYKAGSDLNRVVGGFGVSVVSTNRGVMLGDDARKKHLGGEVICKIW